MRDALQRANRRATEAESARGECDDATKKAARVVDDLKVNRALCLLCKGIVPLTMCCWLVSVTIAQGKISSLEAQLSEAKFAAQREIAALRAQKEAADATIESLRRDLLADTATSGQAVALLQQEVASLETRLRGATAGSVTASADYEAKLRALALERDEWKARCTTTDTVKAEADHTIKTLTKCAVCACRVRRALNHVVLASAPQGVDHRAAGTTGGCGCPQSRTARVEATSPPESRRCDVVLTP